jgi:hypothetical protein
MSNNIAGTFMAKVYFKPVDSYARTVEVSRAAREVLEKVVEKGRIKLEKKIPLKVHFGEKGNKTHIGPENYDGIIDYLKKKGIKNCFIETNVLYVGARTTRRKHIALAREHGFTALPIIIADGEAGEDYLEVEINKNHFSRCKIGRLIAQEKQLIVLSHFKGHMLAGFGGAIKQLGMGCAARGGKLDQHSNSELGLRPEKCLKCMTCLSHCPRAAIEISPVLKVDKKKCIGCAACIAACPQGAFSIDWASTSPVAFRQKLAEYAFAAQKNKDNIYINFALNITKDCDCESRAQTPIASDIGVFASTDPVAIDAACYDMLNKREGRQVFGGSDIFDYAEEIGLGTMEYKLIEI